MKIIIFSGFGEFEYAKKAIQYNVSEYLLKPVTAVETYRSIEKYVSDAGNCQAGRDETADAYPGFQRI